MTSFPDDVKESAMLAVIAALFSVLQLISTYISHDGSFLYSESHDGLFNALLLVTFFLLYFIGGKAVCRVIDRCQEPEDVVNGSSHGKWHGLAYFAVIILGWSPWLYAFYPGSLWYDMCYEYDQYYGAYRFDSEMQFPPFPTFVMGLLMDIGKNVFQSDNVGMFLYIILQTVVCAAACTKALTLLGELGARRRIVCLFLLFYAFFPDFGASAQMGANNVLNYGLTLLACTYIFRIYRHMAEGTSAGSNVLMCLGFITCALLSSLWRREMFYIFVFVTAVLVIYGLRRKRRGTSAVLLSGILLMGLSASFSDRTVIGTLMGHEYSTTHDSKILSLPLRQIGHFVRYRGDLVSDMEERILDMCFDYGYYGIARNYNPALADPLIFSFTMEDPECVHGVSRVYWSFFRKDPALFLESLIAASYGYYSVIPNSHSAPEYVKGLGMRLPLLTINKEPDIPFGHVSGIEYRAETKELREMLAGWLVDLERAFNAFFGFGICTFLLIVLCSYSVLKERKAWAAIPHIVPLMLCLACIASPVNDCGRYYIGIFYVMPLLFGAVVSSVCLTERNPNTFHNQAVRM